MDSHVRQACDETAASLSNVYVLVVGALTEGDLDVKFLWCSKSCPFGIEYPVKKIEALGKPAAPPWHARVVPTTVLPS
jgi:hypothetical protein